MAGTTYNPYRFGGQFGYRTDPSSRLYIRQRQLDTAKGRWLSRDPVPIVAADSNFYWYVKNNPVNYIDPDGNAPLRSGTKIPKPGFGPGQCPGKAAYDLIIKTINSNKACAAEIKKTCPSGFAAALATLPFRVGNPCVPSSPGAPSCYNSGWSSPPGQPGKCIQGTVCITLGACVYYTVAEVADLLLFETINGCNCKYKNANPNAPHNAFEDPANKVEKVCNIPGSGRVQNGGGGFHPIK